MLRLLLKTCKFAIFPFLLASMAHICAFPYFRLSSGGSQQADLIIAYAGDDKRISTALSLATGGMSTNVAATGTSKETIASIAKNLADAGKLNLLEGGRSRSTFEDVYATAKLTEQYHFGSVLLVTSAYHMPRALFLLRSYLLLTSGGTIKVAYYAMKTEEDFNLRLCCNEMIKMWGSLAEMAGYLTTHVLLRDSPLFGKIRLFCHTHFLLRG